MCADLKEWARGCAGVWGKEAVLEIGPSNTSGSCTYNDEAHVAMGSDGIGRVLAM
jgi:hypothetical protein